MGSKVGDSVGESTATATGEGVGGVLVFEISGAGLGAGLEAGLGLATIGREAETFDVGGFVRGLNTDGGGAVAASAGSSSLTPHLGASTQLLFSSQKKSSPTSIYWL